MTTEKFDAVLKVRVQTNLKKRLNKIAKLKGRKKSDDLREALRAYVESEEAGEVEAAT